jgi:hypothetical protein
MSNPYFYNEAIDLWKENERNQVQMEVETHLKGQTVQDS